MMSWLLLVLLVGGAVATLVASVWFLFVAFRESILWGLACLVCSPIGPFLFLLTHGRVALRPFGLYLLGVLAMAGGAARDQEVKERLASAWSERARAVNKLAPAPPTRMYRWTDASGDVSYTDDFSTIPERYRASAQTTLGGDIAIESRPVPGSAAARGRSQAQAGEDGSVRLLLFRADWCPACRQLDRNGVIDRFAARHDDVPVVRVDVDREEAQARRYGINSIPTVVLVDSNGDELARPAAGSLESLERAIARIRTR
jgi:thiol-disulfide isomerase/thioredoxin